MKYEMIFGEQLLFDGAPDDIVAVRLNNYSRISYGYLTKEKLDALSVMDLKAIPIVAMRRIIAEPKRWTVEDQKAGRMPEVGWVVRATGVNEDARIAAINNDAVCVVFEDGGFITLHVSGITPIETPYEKAQREEDEFFFALKDEWQNPESPPISSASFEVGVRAAYRKLKGGE